MSRVLKPGGTMVISTPNWLSMHGFDRFFFYSLLGKKDNHPYDKWKSYSILRKAIEQNPMQVAEYKSVCFIPGFVVVNRLPNLMKKLIVLFVTSLESLLQNIFSKNGYIIVIKATKQSALILHTFLKLPRSLTGEPFGSNPNRD